MASASTSISVTVPYIIDVATADYLRLDYHASDVRAIWKAVAAQTGPPVIPACPSAIVIIKKISN